MTESTAQPGASLFSGLVLFFVITVQVAAVKGRSTQWPYPVLQLESEREPSDDSETHFTKWLITHPARCQVPLLLLLRPPMKNKRVPGLTILSQRNDLFTLLYCFLYYAVRTNLIALWITLTGHILLSDWSAALMYCSRVTGRREKPQDVTQKTGVHIHPVCGLVYAVKALWCRLRKDGGLS